MWDEGDGFEGARAAGQHSSIPVMLLIVPGADDVVVQLLLSSVGALLQ